MKKLCMLAVGIFFFGSSLVSSSTLIRGTLNGFGGPFSDEVDHAYTRFTLRDMNGNLVPYYFREYENFLGWVEENYQAGDILAITGDILYEINNPAKDFMIPTNINLRRGGVIVATVHSTPASTPFYSEAHYTTLSSPGLYIGVYCEYSANGQVPPCPSYPAVKSISFSAWCSILGSSPVPAPYTALHGDLLYRSIGCQ